MLQELFDDYIPFDAGKQPDSFSEIKSQLPNCRGVVLFASEDDTPIQILIASSIRRSAAAKLSSSLSAEENSKRSCLADITRRIYYCCCYNEFASLLKYYTAAKPLFPHNYTAIAVLPKPVCVMIDIAARCPCFAMRPDIPKEVSKKERLNVFAPFTSRKAAVEFANVLNEVFSLCRRPELSTNQYKAASCPYLQMQQCPGPCVGKITKEEHAETINMAVLAAEGHTDAAKDLFIKAMKSAAERLDFERANFYKTKIERLEVFRSKRSIWVTELSKLAAVHIGKSAKIQKDGSRKKTQTFEGWFISSGCIKQLGVFCLEDTPSFHKRLLEACSNTTEYNNGLTVSERISILSYFLYRQNRAGIWIKYSDVNSIATASELNELITEKFYPPSNKDNAGI